MNSRSLLFVCPEENKSLPWDEFCSAVGGIEGGASSAEGIPEGWLSFYIFFHRFIKNIFCEYRKILRMSQFRAT